MSLRYSLSSSLFGAAAIAAVLSTSSSLQAQSTVQGSYTLPSTRIEATQGVQLPMPTLSAPLGSTGRLDTLRDVLMRSSGVTFYTYAPDPNNPSQVSLITGTNNLYGALGVRYHIDGDALVHGALVAFPMKIVQGVVDTFFLSVDALSSTTKYPSGSIAEINFTTSDIDTSTSTIRFTPFMLPQPAQLTPDFAIVVNTLAFSNSAPADIVGVYSNVQGDGKMEDRAFFLTIQNNQIVGGNLSTLFNVGGQPIDIDPFIIPIIEPQQTASVGKRAMVNGLRVIGTSQGVSSTTLKLETSEATPLSITVMDVQGRVVSSLDARSTGGGVQEIDLPTSSLSAGTYFCAIATNQSRVAVKMNVVR